MNHARRPALTLLIIALIALPGLRAGAAGGDPGDPLIVSPDGPYTSLEAALADAANGAVIEVRGGVYPGPLVIEKSVTLQGVGRPVIDGGGEGTVVTLAAPDSAIRGFDIRASGVEPDRDHAGITLAAARTAAEDNRLTDVLFGIFVAQADYAVVRGNEVTGKDEYDVGRKGDGIRLWYSQHVIVERNHVYNVRDVVVWYSSDVTIRENVIEDGRYGVHLMYCDDAIIERNSLLDNSVGIYVMYSNASTLRENTIRGQRGPSGYGLAFKDADNVEASSNLLINNRAGLFIDGTPFTPLGFARYTGNIVAFNDVGVILQPSVRGNQFENNSFYENAEQVSIQGGGGTSTQNSWQGNFWSDYSGFDADGNGTGDIPYHSERLFESLYDREERLRALHYSPAVQAIEFAAAAFPVVKPQPKLSDDAPLIEPLALPAFTPRPETRRGMMTLAAALVLGAGLACGAGAFLTTRAPADKTELDGASRMDTPDHPTTARVIKIESVSKRYGSIQALDHISFEASGGEAVALWGANGAGKTTLIKSILGLIAFQGQITVGGHDVRRQGKRTRSLIGYVPQETVFYDWSVTETMAFYARLKKADRSRIPALLEQLGLGPHVKKAVSALSGGLKQRLALAVALLSDPPILLLDEPTANLDAAARRDYLALLGTLRDQGKLILFASHRLEDLDALADRVLLMDRGHLTDALTPGALRERLAPELDLVLRISEAQRQAALQILIKLGLQAHFNGSGTVVVRVPSGKKMHPLDALAEQGIEVLDFDLEQTSWN